VFSEQIWNQASVAQVNSLDIFELSLTLLEPAYQTMSLAPHYLLVM